MNFTLRIWQPHTNTYLAYFRSLVVSGIHIMTKWGKFGPVELNKKQGFKVSFNPKQLHHISGSNGYPVIAFKGEYLDIHFENFPHYPCPGLGNKPASKTMVDEKYYYSSKHNEIQEYWPQYRKVEILNLTP